MEIWSDEPRMEGTQLPLIDDQKWFAMVRQLSWPDGVTCPHCDSAQVTRRGLNETRHKPNYPLPNLYVSMLQRMGLQTDRFASSTGTMRGLELT